MVFYVQTGAGILTYNAFTGQHQTSVGGMAIGAGIKGGRVYGAWPGLERDQLFEGRDLQVTTDFRDVFAEVVTPGTVSVGDDLQLGQ